MVIPPSMASELGLESFQKVRVISADRREVEADYSLAYVRLVNREAPVPVLVMTLLCL